MTNLQKIRKEKKLTQKELAEKSKVNIRNIKAYERKQIDFKKASIETGLKIAEVLETDLKNLI